MPQYIKHRDDANAKYVLALNEAKLLRKSGDSTHTRPLCSKIANLERIRFNKTKSWDIAKVAM